MIGSGAWCDLAGLPRATFDELFARGADVVVAGAFNPTGTIEAVDGGYRVSGRWGFASDCEHADVLFGNCIEGFVDGVPQLRMAVFTPDEVEIEDTWTATGLCCNGEPPLPRRRSRCARSPDVCAVRRRTLRRRACDPRFRCPALFSLVLTSAALGIAQGALDDIVALATDKVPLLDVAPLAANPVFDVDARHRRYRAAGGARTAPRDGVVDVGDRHRPHAVHARAAGPRAGATAVWATSRRSPSSTRPTALAAAPRCTRSARCSGGSVTSTPWPSTSSCGRTRC